MQTITLVCIVATPVPQGAHWLIRKQVRLADQARYHHALTASSLGSDCQACTARLRYTTCSVKGYPWQQELHTHTPFPMGRGSFAFSIMIRLSSWNRINARLWSLSLNLQRRKIRQQLRKQVLRLALLEKQLCNSIYQLSHALLTLSDPGQALKDSRLLGMGQRACEGSVQVRLALTWLWL